MRSVVPQFCLLHARKTYIYAGRVAAERFLSNLQARILNKDSAVQECTGAVCNKPDARQIKCSRLSKPPLQSKTTHMCTHTWKRGTSSCPPVQCPACSSTSASPLHAASCTRPLWSLTRASTPASMESNSACGEEAHTGV